MIYVQNTNGVPMNYKFSLLQNNDTIKFTYEGSKLFICSIHLAAPGE